jgi:NAD(P)-dependent dehydrogenase (short-subunit alcohol dehydrogenase family)
MLDKRVAVVTGAGRGLGASHARVLAASGVAVVVNDLDRGPAQATVAAIEAAGGTAMVDTTDVASIAGGRQVVRRAIDAFGRIDVLVNNAGFARGGGTAEDPHEDELDGLMDVHLKAALGTMAEAIPDMRTRGWGRIVNTVSEVALDARFAGALAYGAAKAALWSATLTAAAETAAYGITVNAVSPGARTRLNADLLDAGFRDGASTALYLDPVHVSVVVAFLASEAAADVTGRVVHAAGGQLREYRTTRTGRSALVERIQAAPGATRDAQAGSSGPSPDPGAAP